MKGASLRIPAILASNRMCFGGLVYSAEIEMIIFATIFVQEFAKIQLSIFVPAERVIVQAKATRWHELMITITRVED
jgi:hypothetical protein